MRKGKWVSIAGLAAVLLLTVSCLTALADDIAYTYDDLGRLTGMVHNDGSTILTMGHAFDETGNVVQINTANSIADADGDQMPDGWETAHGLNPNNPNDALLDSDGDGLTNLAEYQAGTNPALADTDGDGVPDGAEIAAGTDPLDPASHPSQDADIPFMSDLAMALLMLLLIGQGIRKMPGGPSRWLFPVLFLLILPLAASPVFAEPAPEYLSGPGWFMQDAEPVSCEEAEAYLSSLPEQETKGVITPMAATTASPEIVELARALRHDPKLIYDYVHNHIDYVPYFGSLKGATLTLLDGSGNDFDQASLMIALLRQSGFTAQYIYGRMTIPDADSANWLGVDATPTAIGNVLANGGIPRTPLTGARFRIDRVWVKATIDDVDYLFDPAFKSYSTTTKIDLATAMGYDQADFLAGATTGATVGTNYIQNMNEGGINTKLATYAANLAAAVRNQHPNATIEEIVGGRSINQTNLTQYATTLPFTTTVTSTWDDIPTNQTTTIKIQHAGINYTASTQDLSGKRLTITYAGTDNRPELRLDGGLLASGTATTLGSRNNCTVTVNHPYAAQSNKYMDDDQYGQPPVYSLESGRSYAIVYNFGGVSNALLPKLQQQLAAYKAQGLADGSESVLGETLNIMGMTWLKEVAQSTQLLSTISETIPVMHHNVGVMAQEVGYFIDVKAGATSISLRHDNTEDKAAHFKNFALIGSAFEHGVLEQLAGSDKPGVSTMKLFQIANTTGRKVFLADSANYGDIRPHLDNYTSTELDEFQAQVTSGRILILPDNGQLVLNQWRGKGYISKNFTADGMSLGMIIGGNFFGGFVAQPGTAPTTTVSTTTQTVQTTSITPATVNLNITPNPVSLAKDPVEMAGGAFLVDRTDLTLGGAAPRGLAFSRSYTSAAAMTKGPLGNGWSHGHDIRLTPASHGEPGLGLRQPVDAAAMTAALYVGFDLIKTQDTLTTWMAASLVSKWAVDRVIDNAMVVQTGNKSMEFIKLADGSYAAPPGITTQLVKNGDNTFSLVERFGGRVDFNSSNKASRLIDADGNTLSLTYNGSGNLGSVSDAAGRTLSFGYDTNLRVNRVTDSTGRYVTYGYNGANDLATFTDPENKSWAYGYDSNHRLTTMVNPLAITTATNAYDSLGRVMTQTVPRQGTPSSAVYNFYFSGFRNVEEDAEGRATTYFYDKKGREYAIEDSLGARSSRSFDGQDHAVQVVDARNHSASFLYDGNHNLTQTTNALGKNTAFTYDAFHRLTDVTDPLGHRVQTDYDSRHHPIKTTVYPAAGQEISTSRTYHGNGLPSTSTDGRGVVSTITWDAHGNPDTSRVGNHPAVDYTHDPVGRMTRLTDRAGAHTAFTYDKRGLRLTRVDPLGKTASATYDNEGKLASRTDRNNHTIQYTYTATGKPATISYPGGGVTSYTYDLRDNLVQRQDNLGITGLDYDAVGRITAMTDPHNFATGYEYDAAGNMTRVTYPGNKTVSYTYDALNRLETVTIDWLGKTASYQYDEAGRMVGLTQFNDTVTTYGYDNANRLTDLENLVSGGGAAIAAYHFTLDGNGNRTHSSQTTPLAPATSDASQNLTYNPTKTRLLSAGSNNFTWDNEGQLATGYGKTYSFDYEHRLTGISGGGSTEAFSYDGAGNRLRATRNGVTTRYVYDISGNLIAEADSSNVISRYFIHGAGLLAMVTSDNSLYCYHFDATGHTVALTNATKTIMNKYAYTPFGVITGQTEAIPQPFKYAGQHGVMAESNGFYYMRARFYDPYVQRFMSEDPLGFDGGDLNLYAYVGNNPIMGVDPWGLSWRSVALGSASVALNSAALATIYNPVASGYIKMAGIVASGLTVINAGYEYYAGDISRTELAIATGTEAANILGGFAAKPVEAFVTATTRSIGVATTAMDAVQTIASQTGASSK